MRNYEGMFLLDPAVLTDWESVQKEVFRILERAGAEVVACSRWDERRLAYEIKGRKRGVYALTYFKADPEKITGIERDVTLSESALRCLILRVDHMTEDEMKEAASTTWIEQQKTAAAAEGESAEEEGGEEYGRRRERRRGGGGEERRSTPVEAADVAQEE